MEGVIRGSFFFFKKKRVTYHDKLELVKVSHPLPESRDVDLS